MDDTKTCPKCGVTKPATREFFHVKDAGRSALRLEAKCKTCKNRADYHRRRADPEYERKKEERRRWGRNGVYVEMVAHQGGEQCAICRTTDNDGRRFAIDHCHKTGIVRGLLCYACNIGLGKFEDDPSRMLAAHDYVLYPPCAALGHVSRFVEQPALCTFQDIID